ncbi:hypothetical protein [Roseateles sp.]|uniref:hypothetical protein n=1 Tax=Roseateles sp. TaxID=1971397 RepID=UPI003D0A8F7D
MPFAPEFDDVYATIKSTVESVAPVEGGRCFRLDDSRPAGRITDRLLAELKSATVCIADITNQKPNVMWEIGFAMALSKPTLIITQDLGHLPFDIKDMQSLEYDRSRLNATLASPLKRSLLDTLSSLQNTNSTPAASADDRNSEAVGSLMAEVAELKTMVSEVVTAWKERENFLPAPIADTRQLEGDWLSKESGSHVYARSIHGQLIAPYCFGGDDGLTGVYYEWRRIGEYWFAKYKWLDADLSGFSFLRMQSVDLMNGAWWSSEQEVGVQKAPPKSAGVTSTWIRRKGAKTPKWATAFFKRLEIEGVETVLSRY